MGGMISPADRRCRGAAPRFGRRKSICRQALETIGQTLQPMLWTSAAIPSWQLRVAHGGVVHASLIRPTMRRRSMPRRRQPDAANPTETIRPLDPADDLVRRSRSAATEN